MAPWRVFVLWTHPLFHDSVRLLLEHPEVQWVGGASDYTTAPDEIVRRQPDTVLVETIPESPPAGLLEILAACPASVRVISLSLADKRLTVYQRDERTLAQAEDLLNLILRQS